MEVLVHNQLRTDAARLPLCVFVGCMLPEIAMTGTQGRWSNVAALFLSFSFHVAAEIYALQNGNNNSTVEREAGPWFVSSGVVLSLAASSLLLLLGAVMLVGKLQRPSVGEYDIPKLLSVNEENKVMGAKVAHRLYLLHYNNGDNLIFYLQCIFILVGWILMLWRWFKAAFYCENLVDRVYFIGVVGVFPMLAAIVGYMLCPELVARSAWSIRNRDFTLRCLLIFISCVAPILLLFGLVLAMSLVWLFCFICWYFSVLVFSSQFVQHLYKFDSEGVSRNEEYSKYQSILEGMDFTKNETLIFWKVNKKSFDRIKGSSINEFSKIAHKNCSSLLSIMGSARVAENQRLPLHDPKKHSWMKAVSRIFSVIAGAEIGINMKEAFTAYKEAQDVLKFVDCPDILGVNPLNIFDNLNLESFIDSMVCEIDMYVAKKKLKKSSAAPLIGNQENVDKLVRDLNRLGEEMFGIQEWCDGNMEELSVKLCKLVGHVIVSCLLEAPDLLVKYTRQWAQNLDEERIEKAIEIAGKVNGVLENVGEEGQIHSKETRQIASQSRAAEGEATIGPSV